MKNAVKKLFTLLLLTFTFCNIAYAQDNDSLKQQSIVKVAGQKGNWHLSVNGEPFYIKGIGCGEYLHEENIDQQFSWCKELGANAIRRWGRSDYDDLILKKCKEYNLMAVMAIWLPVTIDYSSDEDSKKMLLEQMEEFVNKYKNHPNLLMWGIGNEVIILGEIKLKEWKNITLTDEEKEKRRIGFAKFLQTLIKRVHEIDPNHPVIYAGAGLTALKYIKKYAPDLDIYGINFYAGAPSAYLEWKNIKADIPYIFTEFGPLGPWEAEEDINEQPIEPTDGKKAKSFKKVWQDYILEYKGYNLGGFAFHLTEKKLAIEGSSPTWWGVTYNSLKNASFWALRMVYTGKKASNYPPAIKEFKLSKTKNLKPRETIHVTVEIFDKEHDPLRLEFKLLDIESLLFLDHYTKAIKEKGEIELLAPNAGGVYRLYLFVTDGKGNIASVNETISVMEESISGS